MRREVEIGVSKQARERSKRMAHWEPAREDTDMGIEERRTAARDAARPHQSTASDVPTVVKVHGNDGDVRFVERFTVAEGRRLLEGGSPRRSAAPPQGRPMQAPHARPLPKHEYSAEVIQAFTALADDSLKGQKLIVAMRNAAAFGVDSVNAAVFVSENSSSLLTAFASARTIGYVSDLSAIDALVELFRSGDVLVAVGAARALVEMRDRQTDVALEQLLDRVPTSDYVWDFAQSVVAHRQLPDLYRRDPATVCDDDVWSLFRVWAEQCRMDPFRMAAIAQPLEYLKRVDALEMDVLTETIWRAVCAARLRSVPAWPINPEHSENGPGSVARGR